MGPRRNKIWLVIPFLTLTTTFRLAGFSQNSKLLLDSALLFQKANDLQIADYRPKNGKNGKDVGFLIELLTLGSLNKQGKDGKNGPDLIIYINTQTFFSQKILLVKITSSGTNLTDTFYLNPDKGQLQIIADGSNGGKGGISDKGIQGENGKAGKGGNIEVILDNAASHFIRCKCLLFSNKDGEGRDVKQSEGDEVFLENGKWVRPYDKSVKWVIKE